MCKAIEDKIRNLLNGKEVITAGDPEAIEKLKNKLANLEQGAGNHEGSQCLLSQV